MKLSDSCSGKFAPSANGSQLCAGKKVLSNQTLQKFRSGIAGNDDYIRYGSEPESRDPARCPSFCCFSRRTQSQLAASLSYCQSGVDDLGYLVAGDGVFQQIHE